MDKRENSMLWKTPAGDFSRLLFTAAGKGHLTGPHFLTVDSEAAVVLN